MMKSNLILAITLNYPILMNLIIMMIILFPYKNNKMHPMTMIIMLMLLTMFISLKMNFMSKTWMNFILFLVMIGGLMIIFMYIISLINNKNFYMNLKNIMLNITKNFILMILIMLMYKFFNNNLFMNTQDLMNFNLNFMENKNEMDLSELYNFNKFPMMFIMIYLYFSMICIMNICYKLKSPLRQLYLYE